MNLQHLRWATLMAALALGGCIDETEETPAREADQAVAMDDAAPMADAAVMADAGPAPDQAVPPPSCGNEDDLYPNQGPDGAEPIELGFARQDLFICPDSEDWFALPLAANQAITVTLLADPVETDLDLSLLDANGEIVGDSAGEIGEESLAFVAPADGTWFVRVNGYRGEATYYALAVQGGCRTDGQCAEGQVCRRSAGECVPFVVPECGADRNEPNDRDDQATPVEIPASVRGVTCDGDRDWFAFEANDGDTIDLLLSFDAGKDLDLLVTDLDTGAIIDVAQGDSRTNPERLTLTALPAGRYGAGVFAFNDNGPALADIDFTLELAGRSGACQVDRDCVSAGLPVCDAGVCRAVDQPSPVALGGRCDSDEDCGADAQLCYTGGAGGHDNVCTIQCQGDAGCAALGEGATCVPISNQSAVCFPPCESDDDCSAFRTCQARTCEIRGECRGDADCDGAGEACQVTPFGRYCGLVGEGPACGDDPAPYTDNGRAEGAPAVPTDGVAIEGLNTCDADTDWFTFEVTPEQAAHTLEVSVSFRSGVDIDVYVYDAAGAPVAEATSPDQTTEVARARWIAPGTYQVQVDQFSSDMLADTAYSLAVTLTDNDDACTVAGNECGRTEPLRAACDEATGACAAIEGRGEVPLGSLCDSDDDCVAEAAVCWTFEGGAQGYNICTIACQGAQDCAAVPDTVCTPFQGFAACLPPRN